MRTDDEIQIRKLAEVLAEKPQSTVLEVAEKAGISKATLYRLYGTKEGLVSALKAKSVESLLRITAAANFECSDARESLARLTQAHMDEKELLAYLYEFQDTWEWECWRTYYDSIDKFFLVGQSKRLFKINCSAQFLSDVYLSSVCGMIDGIRRGRIASRTASDTYLDFFLNGVKT